MSSPPLRPLRFYFDYISPNAYLAWLEFPRLAETYRLQIEPVPTLFAGLLEANGQLGPAEIPAKTRWMWRNTLRKAAIKGATMVPPAFHPFNPLASLRATSCDAVSAHRMEFVDALFRAIWADGKHCSELAAVCEVAASVGIDPAALMREAQSAGAKAKLRADTDAAIEAGVFGVPTMEFGGELFWGFDDLPYLEMVIAGNDPLDAAMLAAPPRPPASAQRRRFRSRG